MGYNTYYQLSSDCEITPAIKRVTVNGAWSVGDVMDGDVNRWDRHEWDMVRLSEAFPGHVFRLEGQGEEVGDHWVKFFACGQVEAHAMPKWDPPEDPSDAFRAQVLEVQGAARRAEIEERLAAAKAEVEHLERMLGDEAPVDAEAAGVVP